MNVVDKLHDLGGEEPPPPDLADRALERAHQRGRRKGAIAVAGAALAVVLVAGAVLTGLNGTTGAARPLLPASTSHSVLDQPRVNVLLLGSDAGPGRIGTRPDTIVVASIDTATGRTTLFGLPRNLEHVPFRPGTPQAAAFPDGFACADHACLLNAVWRWAEESGRKYYPDAANPGLTATKEVVEQTTGLTVDETVVVTMKGLQALVDAVGGVDVTVNERLPIGGNAENQKARGWLEKGRHHLNGYQALWYARSRWSTDDYSRMARQQCLLGDLLAQTSSVDLPRLVRLRQQVTTSIGPGDLPGWVALAEKMKGADVIRGGVVPADRSNPDFDALRAQVRSTLAGRLTDETRYWEPC